MVTNAKKIASTALCATVVLIAIGAANVARAAKTEEVTCSCAQDLVFVGGWSSKGGDADPFYRWVKKEYPISFYYWINDGDIFGGGSFGARQERILNFVRENLKSRKRKVLLIGHSMGGAVAQNISNRLAYLVDKDTKKPCVEAIPVDAPMFELLGNHGVSAPLRFIIRGSPLWGMDVMSEANDSLVKNEIPSLNWTKGIFGNGTGIHSPWDTSGFDAKDPAKAALAAKEIRALISEINGRIAQRCGAVTASISADRPGYAVGDKIKLEWESSNAKVCTGSGFDTSGKTSGETAVSAAYSRSGTNIFSLSCYRDNERDTGQGEWAIATTTVEVYEDEPSPTPTALPTYSPTATYSPGW